MSMAEYDGSSQSEVSRLIELAQDGDEASWDQLFDMVYDELRSLARSAFNGQQRRHTLQPTALVHEAWLKLSGRLDSVEGRRHFLAVAAKAMRQVLTDHARAAARQKRGGGQHPTVSLEADDVPKDSDQADLVALDEALSRLTQLNERVARVVELRLLGAMTIPEIADTLGVSPRTVDGDWSFARTWLRRELTGD